jgi:16S rRNA processing protein RimM
VVLAILRRARGIRGEVLAESLGSSPERFRPGLGVTLHDPRSGSDRAAEIEQAWTHGGRLVLKFAGIETRDAAEALKGLEVRLPESERPDPPAGQYYLSDLIGCRIQSVDGKELGEVTGWHDFGGPALLEVGGDGGLLVPLVPEICRDVDVAGRRIVVELPEGLEDLNRA